MCETGQLGDTFVSKKVLEAIGIAVPEEALGFYTDGQTLCIEVMETGDGAGPLMIQVDTLCVPLTEEQVSRLKQAGCYSREGFRLGQ